MLWVGITGDIGSGKSTVSHILRQKGYEVLEADKVVHDLYELDQSLIAKLKKTFGSHIEVHGKIQRNLLLVAMQKHKDGLSLLESIVHPKVREYVSRWKEKRKESDVLFYEVPLLFEKNLEEQFDMILFVHADREITKERLKNRNQWSEKEIELRQKWLMHPSEKINKSTYVIENHGDEKGLEKQVSEFLNNLPREN